VVCSMWCPGMHLTAIAQWLLHKSWQPLQDASTGRGGHRVLPETPACPPCSQHSAVPNAGKMLTNSGPRGEGHNTGPLCCWAHALFCLFILLIYFAHLGRARDDLGLVLLCEFGDRSNTSANYLNDCASSEARTKGTCPA